VRTKSVPVIVGALRTINKGSDQNLQLLPGHPSAMELQKITLMSTAHTSFVKSWGKSLPSLLRSGLTTRLSPNN